MKKFYLPVLCSLLLLACKEEEQFPILEIPSYEIESLAQNEIDKNRLCLAQSLARLLLDENFREYLREQLINTDENWNNEFVLIHHLNDVVYSDVTLIELIKTTINSSTALCIQSVEEFEEKLLSDALLVVKIPDIISAENWNVNKTLPFLYVQTTALVRGEKTGDQQSIIGIHPSGLVDRYLTGEPSYFPLVLKNSEDFILVDESLRLHNAIDFNTLHSHLSSDLDIQAVLSDFPIIENTAWHLVFLNTFLHRMNTESNAIQEIYPLDNCTEDCVYTCIPEDKRKLISKSIQVHSQNQNAFDYEYSSVYRFNSQLILSDNVLPLFLNRQMNSSDSKPWKKTFLGSFRVNDLFDVQLNHQIVYTKYKIEGELFDLPQLTLENEVQGKKDVDVDRILLAEEISEGDLLKMASYRVKLDLSTKSFGIIDNNVVLVSDIVKDNVLNYDLFCILEEMTLGFNSISVKCDL